MFTVNYVSVTGQGRHEYETLPLAREFAQEVAKRSDILSPVTITRTECVEVIDGRTLDVTA